LPLGGNVRQFIPVGDIVFKIATAGADIAHERACRGHYAGIYVYAPVIVDAFSFLENVG